MEASALTKASRVARADAAPVVVKLGGSVIRSAALSDWLEAIIRPGRRLVIVPGGGALADEVRSCQHRLGFGDASAHRMALLAMDQLAWAVAGMRHELEVGATEDDLRGIIGRGHIAVWAPYALISGRSDIEESWRLTSDSLALWLAHRLEAESCYLIKSVARQHARLGAGSLAAEGVVDEAFPAMLARTGVSARLLGRDDAEALAESLTENAPAGALIE